MVDGPDWKSPKLRKLRDRWREIVSGRNASDYSLAKLLSEINTVLCPGEFIKYCIDQVDGLAVPIATAYMYDRMVKAVAVIDAEPVWRSIGWDGVKKLVQVQNRNERVAVCRAVVQEEGAVGKTALDDILKERAPSFQSPRAHISPVGTVSKARALRENEILKSCLTTLIAKYPVLKRDLSEEVAGILRIEGGQIPKASGQ